MGPTRIPRWIERKGTANVKYTMRKQLPERQRYVRPKEWDCELVSCGNIDDDLTVTLILHGHQGSGTRLGLRISPGDLARTPLLRLLIGRLSSMLRDTLRSDGEP